MPAFLAARSTEARACFSVYPMDESAVIASEIVWARMLTVVFGGTVFAVSAVLTSYMLGLGIGSLIAGPRADRCGRRGSLLMAYAVLEIGIAAFALATPFMFEILDRVHVAVISSLAPGQYATALIRFVLSLLGLIAPTVMMGATLPVLCRFLVQHGRNIGSRVGVLYGINTAGAVVGCLAAGFYLIAEIGVSASLYVAAGLNFAVAIVAAVAALWTRNTDTTDAASDVVPEPSLVEAVSGTVGRSTSDSRMAQRCFRRYKHQVSWII